MRRFARSRGPSASEMIRRNQIQKLLMRYGSYSRYLSKSSSSLECSSSLAHSSRSSRLGASSSIQLASASSRRAARLLNNEDSDLKLTMKPSQLIAVPRGTCEMNKGLALAAAQYVSRVLATGDPQGIDSQTLKEDFLHQLERDWGFSGPENLSLGSIRITIRKRDNELENMRRAAELENIRLEKNRLLEEKGVQLRARRVEAVSSSQQIQSSTKVVKTRVVKTVKRSVQSVQTVRAA